MIDRIHPWPAILVFLALVYSATACGEEPHVFVGVRQAGDVFTVDATIDAPVTMKTAWEVLIDFDHMAAILNDLTTSKVISREGNILIVKQEGLARYGLLSFPFQSEREVRIEPMKRILSRNLSGTARRMESEAELSQTDPGQSVQIRYRAEIVPDSMLARMFGASFLRHEIEEQFQSMLAEMKKRESYLISALQTPKSNN